MFPKIATQEIFVKMLEILEKRVQADHVNSNPADLYDVGLEDGYAVAIKDLLIVMTDGNRDEMHCPKYYHFGEIGEL